MVNDNRPNSEKYPEAWVFFEEQARNISQTHLSNLGNYRIPVPDRSGNFIYAKTVESLWYQFIQAWHTPALNAESVYGKIQYIVTHFAH